MATIRVCDRCGATIVPPARTMYISMRRGSLNDMGDDYELCEDCGKLVLTVMAEDEGDNG